MPPETGRRGGGEEEASFVSVNGERGPVVATSSGVSGREEGWRVAGGDYPQMPVAMSKVSGGEVVTACRSGWQLWQ